MKHTKSYIKGHPTPMFTRNDFLVLDGLWDFKFDIDNVGLDNNYFLGFTKDRDIMVPYSYQSISSLINEKIISDYIWYQKEIDFSKYLKDKKRCVLHFEGSDYETTLWVNGTIIGTHKGGYTRFSFDITDNLENGEGKIVVRCFDTYSLNTPRGKQKTKKEPYSCFYTETNGIWKTIWVEFVNEERIESVYVKPSLKNKNVKFTYKFNNIKNNYKIKTIISYDDNIIKESINDIFNKEEEIIIPLDKIDLNNYTWNVNTPRLFDTEYILYDENDNIIDKVLSYFGLVEYKTNGKDILINNKKEYLKMILDQGYFKNGWLTGTEEELLNDVKLMKEIGLNGVRKHQKIEDDRFYYYCDILGLYSWLEMPSIKEYSIESENNFYNEWLIIVETYRNHPSIMSFVPFNESWGIRGVKDNKEIQMFVDDIYYKTKELSTDKFVISDDGWEHTISDIVTFHNYSETSEELLKWLGDLDKNLNNEKEVDNKPYFAYCSGYKYQNTPIMLTEFLGVAFSKDTTNGLWGYGSSAKSTKEYIQRLSSILKTVKSLKDYSGYCITQLTDVEIEVNGLFTIERKPKVNMMKLKELIEI